MHIDDILSGADILRYTLELQNQLIETLKSGGMLFHKCSRTLSNDKI